MIIGKTIIIVATLQFMLDYALMIATKKRKKKIRVIESQHRIYLHQVIYVECVRLICAQPLDDT